MAGPQTDDKQAVEEFERGEVVDLGEVDTEGGRTDAPKEPAEQEPKAVEADAPAHRQDDEEDDAAERRRHGRTAKARRDALRRAKERDAAEIARLRAEVTQLRTGFQEVRSSQYAQGVADVQNRLNEAAQRIINAKARMELAFDADDKVGHTNATMDLLNAQREAEQLSAALDYVKRREASGGDRPVRTEQPEQPKAAPHSDPVTVALRAEFLEEHDWIDPSSDTDDPDSLTMLKISDRLTREGIPAHTARYWQRMRSEGAKALPHRFGAEGDDMDEPRERGQPRRPAGGGPPIGGKRESLSGPVNGKISIPPDMVKMMKETGQWDDPKRRAAVVSDYANLVKQQGAR